ncbi:ATP-dependent DNA helicase RecQ [Mytilus galloprovincialis]|uniref:DNA 3'-5' helicase n=1 Tax=Mytilus galloprovincialis TaxID=29158 RepID=A0A8B6FSI2_MYTGA|nr:ATP-dependent DNA helicase RecQ [Mytilus galloprovincialis]
MADYEIPLRRLGLGHPNILLKPKQIEVLDEIRKGTLETIAILPTGYGKSLIYQLAPLILDGTVIVFSPLSVIQEEQVKQLKNSEALKCCILNTRGRLLTAGNEENIQDLKCDIDTSDISNCNLIFAHPEAFFCTSEGNDLLDSSRGKSFRKAFQHLKELPGFFPGVPRLGLSATVTKQEEKAVTSSLGMKNPKVIKESPDRENIFLEIKLKEASLDIYESYENIYRPLCDSLFENRETFPVTLLFMPLQYIGNAAAYCKHIFKKPTLETSVYGVLCSGQDDSVKNYIIKELACVNPRIKLVFCTSVVGMGFNSQSIMRVIHARPPRSLSDYVQEIGRAGRSGIAANAVLYYSNRDIAANVVDIKPDIIGFCREKGCIREYLLQQYGFEKTDVKGHICCNNCKPICSCIECEMLRIEL